MAWPFYSISSKKKFLKSVFLLVYHQNPQVLKEIEHGKKDREKVLKKGRKREVSRVSANKRGSQYFERRKTFQLQNLFT
jgi:hypothetical protein